MATFDTEFGSVYHSSWPVKNPTAHLVFLHGFGENTGHYERFFAKLNAADFHVWALDQPGHGRSDGERGRVQSFEPLLAAARRLLSFADSQTDDTPLFLMGHSLGGTTAALLTCRDALADVIQGLVLTGTVLTDSTYDIPPDTIVTKDPDYLKLLSEDPYGFVAPPERIIERRKATEDVRREIEVALVDVSLPILLINGTEDTIAPPQFNAAYAGRLKNARFINVPDGHHDIINDKMHDSIAAEVIEYLRANVTQS
ncbi:alpha/beta hydrolase [Leisingera thetidis]|uniref:alpha/beta hydrolase n=1 Tax=Leisingera thetidis TaxID=2930199 RepID=UPI0021F71E7F|nr:lysophospholipase [Leisingera thetidis]